MDPRSDTRSALATVTDPVTDPVTDLLAFDREHLWHPYSSMTAPRTPYVVTGAAGPRLHLIREPGTPAVPVLDAMASWWCAIHGYAVPALDAAARSQLDAMSHVMFGGLTHEPAVALGRRLLDLAPRGDRALEHVFLADSGSIAVEVALKMCWQAHAGTGGLTRTKVLALRGGYHGDTFGAMSVCDPDGGMHSLYAGVLPEHLFAPRPPAGLDPDPAALEAWCAEVDALLEQHGSEVAAVILEPVLQGAGGMHVHAPAATAYLARRAREVGALVIFDEIATGFWRTGTRWAAERVGVVPDVLCVGKALTGGYLTLAAVLTTAEVARRVDASPAGAMMHGPTFMANPLACAVATASLDLVEAGDPAAEIARIEAALAAGLAPAADLDSVVDVRTLGAVGVLELREPVDVARVTRAALDRGVWVRPFRTLVYTMPPYVCTDAEIATIAAGLVGAVAEVHG